MAGEALKAAVAKTTAGVEPTDAELAAAAGEAVDLLVSVATSLAAIAAHTRTIANVMRPEDGSLPRI
jgi:hypothetical protein